MGGIIGGGKGGGGGGGGPDPVQTAQAQAALNRQAALDSARINQISQYTPWAGSYWTGEIGSPDRAQHTVYNPALAGMIFGGPGGGGGLVGQMQGAYSSPLDFSGFQSLAPMGGQEWGGAAPISAPQQSYHPHFSTGGAYMPGGFGGAQGGGEGGAPGMQDPFFGQGSMAARAARGEDPYGGADHSPGGSYSGGYADGYFGGGSVDPSGADHLGAGGLMDAIDGWTGGALSGLHNAGVDEIGGLAATGKGGAGWDSTGGFGFGEGVGDESGTGSTGGGFDSTGADYGDYGDFDSGEGDGGGGDDGGDGGCFLTSAATQMGEADDGPSLSTLRKFRDGYMMETPERKQMVEQYYAVSPKIVKSIPEGDADWGKIGGAVQSISKLIDSGKSEDAMTAYSDMMEGLSGKYLKGTGSSGPDPMYDGDAMVAALSGGGGQRQPAPMTTVPGQGGGQPGLASLLAGGM